MGGGTTPWRVPHMDYIAWFFSTMTPLRTGVREPEAAGAIGWLLYNAFLKTGENKYRLGAEWAREAASASGHGFSGEPFTKSFKTTIRSRPSCETNLLRSDSAFALM